MTLIGRLANAAGSRPGRRNRQGPRRRLVAEQSANDLAAARAAYDALDARLGKKRPAHSGEWPEAEKRLTERAHKRIDRISRELGGFSQSLGQYMAEVLRRWPELRSEMDATAEARADYVALHASVRDDDLPRFEAEFKRQLNTETIRELAQFNSWLRRQAEEIEERVSKINEALGAIPYNPGHYIRLEKQPTINQDVRTFRSDLRSATDDALSGDDDHYSEQRFLDVKRIIERFRGREGYADSDKAWTRRVTDVRNWFVFSASERILETDEEWEHYSDSDGKSGGQKEKLAYTILAASLAYQFGLEWGAEKSRDFRFAVIDEAFGRGSDMSTRYALELFAKLGLQLLIVTPLQKVHVIEPYVKAIGFVDNPGGTFSRLQTMTIEEYRSRRDGRAPMSQQWTTPRDIEARVRRRWDDGSLLRAHAGAPPFSPIEIPVRGPRPSEIGDDLVAVRDWIEAAQTSEAPTGTPIRRRTRAGRRPTHRPKRPAGSRGCLDHRPSLGAAGRWRHVERFEEILV